MTFLSGPIKNTIRTFFIVIILTSLNASSESSPLEGIISKPNGTVRIWSKDKAAWTSLSDQQVCKQGQTLETDVNSTVNVTIEPTIKIGLQEKTSMSFDKLVIDRDAKSIRILMNVVKGAVHITTDPLFGYTALISISTPSSFVDINSADALINVQENNHTSIDVIGGAAKVRHHSNPTKSILSPGTRAIVHTKIPEIEISQLTQDNPVKKTPGKAPKIAILSVQSSTISKDNLERVSDYVAEQYSQKSNAKVLFLENIRSMLQAEGLERLLNCFTDSCISQIGSIAGVDIVIIGGLGQVGNSYLFNLKMVDVLRDKVISRTTTAVEGDLGNIIHEIPNVVNNLVQQKSTAALEEVVAVTPSLVSSDSATKYKETIVWVQGGSFTMGSKALDGGPEESPAHSVKVSNFYIDKYEVTREDFEKVMGHNPSSSKGCAICPVNNVTWQEAQEYCRKMGKRLPTEAEWEYACRAGTETPFSFGTTLSSDQANFDGKQPFGGAPISSSKGRPVAVGNYSPNAWKIYDMHGNVAEWCSDWYDAAYYGVSSPENPKGPKDGKLRVVRGGAWNSSAKNVRSAYRSGYNPSIRLNSIGFRCVKDDKDTLKNTR